MDNKLSAAEKEFQQSVPFACDEERERAYFVLKEKGLTISEAIKLVRRAEAVSLGEAKALIGGSTAWGEVAAAAKPIHEEGMDVLAKLRVADEWMKNNPASSTDLTALENSLLKRRPSNKKLNASSVQS
jgi:ribosomal protein L7/L12